MSPYDDLLLWVSEKRHGGLGGLRAACQWTARAAGHRRTGQDVLDDLLALGHVDVGSDRWSVAPTRLAVLADAGGNVALLGARPRWLVDALNGLDESRDVALRRLADHVYDHGLLDQEGPSTWYLNAGPCADLDALRILGVEVVSCASESLLQRAFVDKQDGLRARTVRPGEPAGRLLLDGPLVSAALSWETSSDESWGTYRYLRNNQRIYAERSSLGWIEMDYRWAVWRASPGAGACIWYSPRDRRLLLPTTVRPPLEIERALVLRTGRLPARGSAPEVTRSTAAVATYDNITLALATQVATLLHKEVTLV